MAALETRQQGSRQKSRLDRCLLVSFETPVMCVALQQLLRFELVQLF